MTSSDYSFTSPDVEVAIDRSPLIVTPETSLVAAIALMGKAKGTRCFVGQNNADLEPVPPNQNKSGCALVMTGSRLLGILTERDIVKLTSEGLRFDQVKNIAEVMTQPVITLLKSNLKDIFAALFLFRRYRIRHLPIVDQADNLIGVISPETIREAMNPANLLKLRRVADVMSKSIVHAPSTTTVLSIAQLMTTHRVSCVVITEADLEENILIPVGIITERDILQFQFLQVSLDKLEARQVMSSPLFILSPEDSLLAAQQEMQRRRVRRLVVSWNWGQGLGIVTQTSMLKVFDPLEMYGVIETLQSSVKQLEQEKAELLALIKQQK